MPESASAMIGRHCDVNDLPRYSPWPARLVGLAPWSGRRKTRTEVMREFQDEKWGALLRRVQATKEPVSVSLVNAWESEGTAECVCAVGDCLRICSAAQAQNHYLGIVGEVLSAQTPASALAELGCGYGRVLLTVAQHPRLCGMPLFAGELTAAGQTLVNLLAAADNRSVEIGACDLGASPPTNLQLPPDTIVFTSYATPYVRELTPALTRDLARAGPRRVVHFEPCIEHFDPHSLLGLMRRRYVRLNHYNAGLLTLLRAEQDSGTLQILDERPTVFGSNPLLPVSVIVWEPRPCR